ncbi:HK97 family phage prohead protease [Formosa sp. S-31]|uniref:HK97 family phage prohead protease n=1 Tax=Formosa sp. S-31 TaxID=2790949 RepID=UPI003EBEB8FB
MPKTRFVFNDEAQKNSYGFFIPTNGVDLTRFSKNPIMLDSHVNSTRAVIGAWEDIKADKGILSGLPVFDSDDESAAVIEGKVNRGFIKSCSMGVRFNRDDLKFVAGELVLEKCELYEVSIVAVPSNANAIRLYVDDSNTPLTEQEVQNLCLALAPTDPAGLNPTQNPQNENMKITLTSAAALALGYAATQLEHDADAVSERVVKLQAEKQAAELKYNALKEAEEQKALEGIKNKVQLAHKAGKINADKIEEFVNLGIANESLLDTTLAAIPAKASLAAQVKGGEAGSGEVKTVEDFMKLSLEQKLAFKAENTEAYKQLFTPKQ